jgi:PAS domain S-box-containing protein
VVSSDVLVRLQRRVLTILVTGGPGETIACELLGVFGGELGCEACALWMPERGDRLVVRSTWNRDGGAVRFDDDAGLAAEAWITGRAAAVGPRVVLPIWASSQSIGVFELRGSEVTSIDADSLDTLATVAQAMGRYLVRDREQLSLRERQAQLLAQIEDALRETQTKLAHLEYSGVIGVVTSGDDGVVIEANDAFLHMFGMSREDLEAGRVRWRDRTPPEWNAADARATAQLLETGVAHAYEKEFFRADGSRLPVIVGAATINRAPLRAICFVLDISERKRVEQELARVNAELEDRIHERTAELQAERQKLVESEQLLRALAQRLVAVREEFRGKLAREIHDVLGQELTGLKMDAAWLLRRIEHAQLEIGESISERLRSMLGAIDQTIGSVRRIASDLRPGVLDDLGLPAAIEWYARDFGSRSGLAIDVELAPELAVGRELATELFRIIQELFTNVVRHAGATTIRLYLQRCGDALELRVVDDGVGIAGDAATARGSLGLVGIRERALAFDGTFTIGAHAPRGTQAVVRIPRSDVWTA